VGVAETGTAVGADGSGVGVGPQADAAIMHRSRIQVIVRCLFIAFHLVARRMGRWLYYVSRITRRPEPAEGFHAFSAPPA
jgi:hypothetical protein